jgi:quinoprotein glucose dehydrogenase
MSFRAGMILLAALLTGGPAQAANMWEGNIERFEKQDAENPPAPGGVLFVGSSSIVLWDVAKGFPDAPALNRGFGGSMVSDVNHFFDRVVTPYAPRKIVFYSGDNDVAKGMTAAEILAEYRTFLDKVAAALPEAEVLVVGIKPSLARWDKWPVMQEVNAGVAAIAAEREHVEFLDVAPVMLKADGLPDEALFVRDGLHMNETGYERWSKLAKSFVEGGTGAADIFDRSNLAAWCVVPFDKLLRGPEARAEMLTRHGIHQLAYDWRAEHIPQFDEEMETLKRWGISLKAFWFPAALDDTARAILEVLKRHDIKTELWVSMGGGDIICTPEEHAKRVADHAAALRPIAEAAAEIGCTVGLYNHGGWFGEPENQIEIIKALGMDNTGIVYNLHHGHHHLARFPQMLETMKPYLYSLNLNGMKKDGEQSGDKILPVGNGEYDLELLRQIRDSGYTGTIGVLGHTMEDAEQTLADNLDGLDWLVAQLDGKDAGPRPPLRVGRPDAAAVGAESLSPPFGKALSGSLLAEGRAEYGVPPITVQVRAQLNSSTQFNILVANDTKGSGAHWEIFTEAGSGELSVYTPGLQPDHVRTGLPICDGKWRNITMQYEAGRIRVHINGMMWADQKVTATGLPAVPGPLGLGRLAEGGFFCDGLIDDVRISRGVTPLELSDSPLPHTDRTLGLWSFDDLPDQAWVYPAEVENPVYRAALPEFQQLPAAPAESLAAALPVPEAYHTGWTRSHGNPHNTRYAAAKQITRDNVAQLAVAWEYRSGDGAGNVQCNPIVVDGTLYAPTAGHRLVALDAATGKERWRFDPGGQPAFRGLTHWPGDATHPARLLFTAGGFLWALDPATGAPIASFGEGGRAASGESRVAGAVFENVFVLPLFARDVAGFDVRTGARLWTFHTIPREGEFGRDTWNAPAEGANCWGGMALDEQRGIAYVSTGSPKPNFAGNTHHGQNLFANCVIALDARTGELRWHFQEIRHDIWDLDIPAPPILASIEREGRRVDVVAQVTKLGNTLVLDRESGVPIYPVRLRRAPVSKLPGERTWPYQPDIELPEPFARQTFSRDDITERTPEARAFVEQHIERADFGWFEPFEENRPTVFYGIHGGAEWTGAAVDPHRGRLYVSSNNVPWIVTVFRPDEAARDPEAPPTPGELVYREHCMLCHGPDRLGVGMNPPLQGLARRMDDDGVRALLRTGKGAMPVIPETVDDAQVDALLDYIFLRDLPEGAATPAPGAPRYTHNGYPKLLDHEGYPGSKPPWGTLNCLDLNTGKLLWQRPLGTYPDLASWGEDDTGAENFGGPSVSAGGVVFCAGTPDEKLYAFDEETGAELWSHKLPFGGYAPPAIYETGGRQYVVIAATGGGKLGTAPGDAWVAFALP